MADVVQQGSAFRSVNVALNPIPFTSGGVETRDIPIGNLLKTLILRLTGNLVVGTAAATLVGNESPLELIQRVEIVTDTNRVLWSIGGRDLYRYAHFMYGKQGELSAPVLTVGTNAFAATLRLPVEMLRFVKPLESYFNTRRYNKVLLRISWGTVANIAAPGGGGTVAISGCSIDLIAHMTVAGFGMQRFDKVMVYEEINVGATSVNLTQDVPRGGLLARMLIRTTRDAATVDNIVNKVSMTVNYSGRMRDVLAWATLQRGNVIEYQLDGGATAGAQIPGYAIIDFTEDGYATSGINTYAVNKVQTVFDVTRTSGVELIRLTYEFLEPLQQAAA